MLTEKEFKRYKRHLVLDQIGEQGQIKLKEAKVLVVGAGGLGCPALQYLACAGIGTIGVIDGDEVDLSNLHRQVLFNDNDIGKNKALIAGKKLIALNPEIKVKTYSTYLDTKNAKEIISEFDIVLDGTDNFEAKYLINDITLELEIPLVYGAIYKLEGQVSVFNYQNGPCYRSLFPEIEGSAPNCSEVGVLGILPGIIGLYQANEVIKICLGIGKVLSGVLLQTNLLDLDSTFIKVPKRTFKN